MELNILLKQHVGSPCKPIVKSGDSVKRGQLIAIPNGVGANIHSSFSGTIGQVTSDFIELLEIDVDEPDENYVQIDANLDDLATIESAGIVGAGGAGFPAFIKYSQPMHDGTVIMNAAECEPVLAHNMHQLETDCDLVLRGLNYVMQITKAKKGIVVIKARHQTALLALMKGIKRYAKMEIKLLPDMYPAGDERVIIREICGYELKPGELPIKLNAIVSNVETLKNVTRAIEERRPVITKDLTIGGRIEDCATGNVVMNAPIGLTANYVIGKVNAIEKPYGDVYIGGPFMGKIGSPNTPVVKTTGGFLLSMPYLNLTGEKIGVLGCECGAQIDELKLLAEKMHGMVVGELNCKRMEPDAHNRLRCTKPGVCPGQAASVMALKQKGATTILVGTCEDRTNTVAKVTPKLGLKLIHKTDFVLRAAGHHLYRRIAE